MNRTCQIVAILSFVLYTSPALAMAACAPLGKLSCGDQEYVAQNVLNDVSATSGKYESLGETAMGYGEANREASASLPLRDNIISFLSTAPTDTSDKSSNSVDGFGALLIVTSDKDWKSKWDTPEETAPHFTHAHSVKRGGSLTLLIFFTNPKADHQNSVNVLCDIKATRPDGSISVNETNLVALKGELKGNPDNIRLAQPVIEFVGEPKDPLGEWIIEVTVKDAVRSVSVPVRASFILVE